MLIPNFSHASHARKSSSYSKAPEASEGTSDRLVNAVAHSVAAIAQNINFRIRGYPYRNWHVHSRVRLPFWNKSGGKLANPLVLRIEIWRFSEQVPSQVSKLDAVLRLDGGQGHVALVQLLQVERGLLEPQRSGDLHSSRSSPGARSSPRYPRDTRGTHTGSSATWTLRATLSIGCGVAELTAHFPDLPHSLRHT